MKKLIAIVMMFFPFLSIFANQPDSTMVAEDVYGIDIDKELHQCFGDKYIDFSVSKHKIDALIWVAATNSDNNNGLLLIYNKQMKDFWLALIQTRAKWAEWIKVAQDNDIANVKKEIPVRFPKVIYGWLFNGRLYARKGVPIKFYFQYENGNTTLRSEFKVISARNRYVGSTYTFRINSIEELDELVAIVEPDNLRKLVELKTSVDIRDNNLFK